MRSDRNAAQPRRDILKWLIFSTLGGRAFGELSPQVLLTSVAKRYRDMKGVSLEATGRLDHGGPSGSNWAVKLRVRPPVTLYEINTGPQASRLVFWTDGARLRTFESTKRRFFDGHIGARSNAVEAMLASLDKARFLYFGRFAQLNEAEAISKQVKEATVKVGPDTLQCFRLEVKPAKSTYDSGPGKETLWIEMKSGIVVRSDVQMIEGGHPVLRSTLWSVVDPELPAEEAVAFTKPQNSVEVDEPALPGK